MAKSKGANVPSNRKRSGSSGGGQSAPTPKQRKKMPTSKFAGPGKSYPMVNASGNKSAPIARNALARAAQNASPGVQAMVRKNVARNFPSIAVTGIRSSGRPRKGK